MKKHVLHIGLILAALSLTSCGAAGGRDATPNVPPPSPEETVAAARGFVELLAKGDFAGAEKLLDAEMKAAMPQTELAATWGKVVSLAGPFKKQLSAHPSKARGFDLVLVKCQFEKSFLNVRVVMNAERQISGLFIEPEK